MILFLSIIFMILFLVNDNTTISTTIQDNSTLTTTTVYSTTVSFIGNCSYQRIFPFLFRRPFFYHHHLHDNTRDSYNAN